MKVSFIGVWETQACAAFKKDLTKEIQWMAQKISPPGQVLAEAGNDGKYKITFQNESALTKEVFSKDRDLCFALASCCHLYSSLNS
jgi:hypothetical protein